MVIVVNPINNPTYGMPTHQISSMGSHQNDMHHHHQNPIYPTHAKKSRYKSNASKALVGLGISSVLVASAIAGVSGATQYADYNPEFGDKFFDNPATFAASVAVVPAYLGGVGIGYAGFSKK